MIKVLIVEDSSLVSRILTAVLDSDSELKVIGVARTGKEGVKLALELKPDIITMDILMPEMDGAEATKQIMAYQPTPILLLTSSHQKKMDKAFQAISFGALDMIEKMSFGQGLVEEDARSILIDKVKLLSKIKVIRHPLAKLEIEPLSYPHPRSAVTKQDESLKKVIAIAASTGGPNALISILRQIPKNFPGTILIVQHITRGFSQGLVEWLAYSCSIEIKLAEDKEKIRAGVAYIAPNDVQMKVKKGGMIELKDDVPEENFKPSADILFGSVAEVYKDEVTGIVLTGMGRDGTLGIKAIKQSGGKTIAQDEKTCVVFGMPKEAISTGSIDKILPLDKITYEILKRQD